MPKPVVIVAEGLASRTLEDMLFTLFTGWRVYRKLYQALRQSGYQVVGYKPRWKRIIQFFGFMETIQKARTLADGASLFLVAHDQGALQAIAYHKHLMARLQQRGGSPFKAMILVGVPIQGQVNVAETVLFGAIPSENRLARFFGGIIRDVVLVARSLLSRRRWSRAELMLSRYPLEERLPTFPCLQGGNQLLKPTDIGLKKPVIADLQESLPEIVKMIPIYNICGRGVRTLQELEIDWVNQKVMGEQYGQGDQAILEGCGEIPGAKENFYLEGQGHFEEVTAAIPKILETLKEVSKS